MRDRGYSYTMLSAPVLMTPFLSLPMACPYDDRATAKNVQLNNDGAPSSPNSYPMTQKPPAGMPEYPPGMVPPPAAYYPRGETHSKHARMMCIRTN